MAKSVRLQKKLAKTGRTRTWQKLGKKGLEAKKKEILATPRPELPKPKAPEIDRGATAAADEEFDYQTERLRMYITDMIQGGEDFLRYEVGLTDEQINELINRIYTASDSKLTAIRDILQNDDGTWKDFYLFIKDRGVGFLDNEDYVLAIQLMMDELGMAY